MHLAAGLSVGLTGLAAGYTIGVVGDVVSAHRKHVRAYGASGVNTRRRAFDHTCYNRGYSWAWF